MAYIRVRVNARVIKDELTLHRNVRPKVCLKKTKVNRGPVTSQETSDTYSL